MDLRERIAQMTIKRDGCWLWKGSPDGSGYGRIGIGGRQYRAHRVSYEFFVGPIPDGFQLDHMCRVRRCVNPDHLEPVSPSENGYRGRNGFALTGRCHSGRHDVSEPSSWYLHANGDKRCLACYRDTERARSEQRKRDRKGTP